MSPLVTRLLIGLAGAIGLLIVWRRTDELADGRYERGDSMPAPTDRSEASAPGIIRGVIVEATRSRFGADYRLRPLLRQVAGDRLRQRHGVDLDDPAAAALLRASAWEYLRGDRPIVRDFRAPGLPLAVIADIVEAVERL